MRGYIVQIAGLGAHREKDIFLISCNNFHNSTLNVRIFIYTQPVYTHMLRTHPVIIHNNIVHKSKYRHVIDYF